MNSMKTIFLLVALTVLLVLVGSFFGGMRGMFLFFLIAVAFNIGTYWFSDKIVLKMHRAQPAPENSRLAAAVRKISQMARLPMPRAYIIDAPYANAFATGRNPEHAAVAATTGLLELLDDSELEGVVAHELAHVKNRDILIGTIAAVIAGAITMISRLAFFSGSDENRNPYLGLIIMITGPIAALLIQMAVSRSREYAADEAGSGFNHNPLGLASALRKLTLAAGRRRFNANPAVSHMYIVNPLSAGGIIAMFSTHPPIEDRIARLEGMARGFRA